MGLKIQMISKEKIKPCSPTSDHLRIHKLSLLDQIAPNTYVPLLLFYTAPAQSYHNISHHLKNSLAETLTHFRPFAGRASRDRSCISCNDERATYIETFVDVDISIVLKHPEVEQLQKLLPCSPYEDLSKPGIEELLAIQVNYFARGGVAIAVSVHHLVCDASSVHTFVESWSAVACGANGISRLTFDFTSLFPPIESLDLSFATYETESSPKTVVRKRFVFESSKIAALREAIGHGPYLDRPTRYEAVAALLWGAFIDATRDVDETIKEHVAAGVVDLRKKMNLPSGERYVGNLWKWTAAHCSAGNKAGYNELAGKFRESERQIDKKWQEIDAYLALSRNAVEQFGKNSSARIFYLSWCNFPLYETDFGWGRPNWIGTGKTPDMGAYFLETSDGKGMEAWVGLPMEDMALFEKNPDILKYSSSFKSLSRI